MFLQKNNFFFYKNFIYSFLFICPIFLWGLKFEWLEIRHIIIILILPIIIKNSFTKKDLKIIILCSFIFIHKIIFISSDKILDSLILLLYLAILIKVIQTYYKIFLNTIDFQINLFLILFVTSSIFVSIYYTLIDNFFEHCIIGCFSNYKFFYSENSHLGMIASSLILYSLFLYSINQKKINILFFFAFCLICYLNYSLTLSVSLVFNSFLLLILFWKLINKKFIFYLVITVTFSLSIAVNKNEVLTKIKSLTQPLMILTSNYYSENISKDKSKISKQNENNKKGNQNESNKINNYNENDLEFKSPQKKNIIYKSLSTDVYLKSFRIAFYSLVTYPLGVGINNFEISHKKFISEVKTKHRNSSKLNIQDGSNNIIKMITEFGIFSFFIFYLIISFFLSKRIELKYKIFLLPNLLTQLFFRGAGYFNGGFIIFMILIFYLLLEKDLDK